MQSIFKMDKLIVNKKGFTVIDTLFSISITLLLCTITLFHHFTFTPSMDGVIHCIFGIVEQAKYEALLVHERQYVAFNRQSIVYKEYEYVLPDQFYIDNQQVIEFNKNGNINLATTVQLCNDTVCKSLVFHLESGHMDGS